MQAIEAQARPEFKGSDDQQELASRVFDVMTGTARFFSQSSAITISLGSLSEFFANADGKSAEEMSGAIETAIKQNKHVFLREEREDGVYFSTTRIGVPPTREPNVDTSHTFASRFTEPLPKPAAPPQPRRRPRQPEQEVFDYEYPADDESLAPEEAPAELDDQAAAEGAPETVVEEPVEEISDLTQASDEELEAALKNQLAFDYSVANFGDQWMAEDKVPRLSRGDLRRIREFILEQGMPVSDNQIVRDVLGIRPNAQEFDLHLFAVNFRLSRETRDFEFVGIPGAHIWTTSGIETPSVAKRKASEVGQDYRVLLDLPEGAAPPEEGVVEHVLTFYEHRHGVLPLDSAFQSIVPGPVLPGQRSAIVRFESPLTYQNFLVEVRFPTGNRGGFLAGFADYFEEHLVPGAFVTIEAGDQPGTYTIEFLTVSGQDRKLLELDEKKNQYKFEAKTFYCAPNEDMLLTENRFQKLAGAAPLEDRVRRQPEDVLSWAFSHVGEKFDDADGQLMAVMDELLGAANIERPMPVELIRLIASSDNYPEFSLDPEADDVIYYRPGSDAETTG